MILKADNKGCSEDEIFETEEDLIEDVNRYYQLHWCEDESFDRKHIITTFEEAKWLFEVEDYTISIV